MYILFIYPLIKNTNRENREHIIKLKGYCPDNRIPPGLLSEGSLSIKNGFFIIF